ncbi:hypothetical protein AB8615_03225 [Litorimonas sp. RW-G-Af-16]
MPLAVAVIIDSKIRDPEYHAFVERAHGLLQLFDKPPMTDAELRTWFDTQKGELTELLTSKRRNTTILKVLSKFEDDVEVENIYDAMVSISVSDREFVQEESDLIKSAGAIWGFAKPPIKVDR